MTPGDLVLVKIVSGFALTGALYALAVLWGPTLYMRYREWRNNTI